MRRSSAPSLLKSKGISPIENNSVIRKTSTNFTSTSKASDGEEQGRTTNRILSLLSNTDSDSQEPNKQVNVEKTKKIAKYKTSIETTASTSCESPVIADLQTSTQEKLIFDAVYRKMQTRKHKTWEGDGSVEIIDRCAILKDENGKELGRNSKVKSDVIFEEGTQLLIGGKEVELGSIRNKITSIPTNVQPPPAKKIKLNFNRSNNNDDLPLPEPSASHQWKFNSEGLPVNKIVIEGFLARALRPHQKEGIKFLYECVMGMRGTNPGQYYGALLADEMGLGKTLQCIALIWTLLNQKLYGRGNEIKRVLIITPRTLVDNWERDIYAWLGYRRLSVYKVDSKNSFQDYSKRLSKIVVVSYETCLRQATVVMNYQWDIIICDEAHCLKNPDTEKSKFLKKLNCKRRILLTGSPCQNNLLEFYEILNHANPDSLGTKEEFACEYAGPIMRSNEPNCTEEEHEIGEECSLKLKSITSLFMLRRTADILIPYLPNRQDLVVFCKPLELQKHVYTEAVNYWTQVIEEPKCLGYQNGIPVLKAITGLRQISNHPAILLKSIKESDNDENGFDEELQRKLKSLKHTDINLLEISVKLKVVKNILEFLKENNDDRDRVLIVSYFTQTLSLLEQLCNELGLKYSRLDGNTSQNARLPMINEFNKKKSNTFVFLLSAKAGGTGINLTGASRLILFDLDWNPANDIQALGRIWRGDQSRPVITYRLLTAGTIEEKIFQRQIKKTGLNSTINSNKQQVKFSTEELKDLFNYQDNDAVNLTHMMLQCNCDCTGTNELSENKTNDLFAADNNDDEDIPGIDKLMKWQHISPAGFYPYLMQDLELLYAQENITFIFRNVVNKKN